MSKFYKASNLIPLILVVFIAKSFAIEATTIDFGIIAVMTYAFIQKLKMDKRELSEKEEVLEIIALLEKKHSSKFDDVQKVQDNDRLAYEGKFSTLNLGMQRKPVSEKRANGWG